jgi:hypothetical protein
MVELKVAEDQAKDIVNALMNKLLNKPDQNLALQAHREMHQMIFTLNERVAALEKAVAAHDKSIGVSP